MAQVSIFIDGGIFSDGVRGQGMSMDMDIMAFAKTLAKDDTLADVFFIAPVVPAKPYPTKHKNQQALFERLSSEGVTVMTHPPRVVGSIFIDAGIETLMTVQLLSGGFDKAIVISNRAALTPALAATRAAGKAVDVAFFDYTMAPGNALAPDGFIKLTVDDILPHVRSGARPPVWA